MQTLFSSDVDSSLRCVKCRLVYKTQYTRYMHVGKSCAPPPEVHKLQINL